MCVASAHLARCADARDALLALRATAVLHRLLHWGCEGADADALRRKAAWLLLFMLCEDDAHRSQLRASHGEHVVLEVCLFAASPERADPALRVAGLFGLQKLSARSAAIRRYLGEGDARHWWGTRSPGFVLASVEGLGGLTSFPATLALLGALAFDGFDFAVHHAHAHIHERGDLGQEWQ